MIQDPRVFRGLLLVIAFQCASIAVVTAQSSAASSQDQQALSDFNRKTKDYINNERSLEAARMKPTNDVAKLEQQRQQLRDAVQQSRANAKQGDLFTPEIARIFRKTLADLLHGPDGRKIRASLNHAEPGAPAVFKVNAVFPNQSGQPIQSVPPTFLRVLPSLPKGLEYCIAGNTLALRDPSANMVVDYLPNAFQ